MLTNSAEIGATMPIGADLAEIGIDAPLSAELLETSVQRRLGTRIRGLRVIVRQDGIELRGVVSTYHAKQIAQHAAMDLSDLPILANDIEVR